MSYSISNSFSVNQVAVVACGGRHRVKALMNWVATKIVRCWSVLLMQLLQYRWQLHMSCMSKQWVS